MLAARELDFCTCRKSQVVGGLLAGGQGDRLLHLQEVPGSWSLLAGGNGARLLHMQDVPGSWNFLVGGQGASPYLQEVPGRRLYSD